VERADDLPVTAPFWARRGATLDLTPWTRAGLTTEQRDDIMARALALGIHVSLGAKGPRGPFSAAEPMPATRDDIFWATNCYAAADRLLRAKGG
jgi:hypothetical protein